ncbi:MAG TPA: universal stress protein [Bacteroidia bacterium]|jgi:nucleotide-binding universal stress UspA family protein|nr:universal stress protein [Bacteroidia bacterium]
MKLNIRNILVPTDFSETGTLALEHAAFLARLTKAEITLVHVMPPMEDHFEIPARIMHVEDRTKVQEIVEEKLKELSDSVKQRYGVLPRTLSVAGKTAIEIIKLAREQKSDLIVMGTHGAKGFEEMFIGSNAHKVVSIAPCPVITIQQKSTKLGFKDIVLPIDRSVHSREKVETAISFASLYASKIHIVGLLEDTADHEKEKLNIVLDQVQHSIEKANLPFTRKVVSGKNLAVEALKYGESVNADLIMIMTDQESALTGIFLGPVSKQIVNHSRIPVMSIKPHYGEFDSVSLGGAYTFY